MFLSRQRFRYRALYRDHFIDVWGAHLQKENLRRNATQKFLQFFSRYLRRTYQRIKRLDRPYKKRLSLHPISSYSKRSPLRRHIFKKTRVTRFFLTSLLRFYSLGILKPKAHFVLNTLIRRPGSAASAPAHSKHSFRRRRPYVKKVKLEKFYFLKRPHQIILTPRMQAYFQATYFGFSSLSGYRAFLKRHATRFYSDRLLLGSAEAMFAHQLFRTGFFPTIRFAYNLIRGGALLLNSHPETRPRRLLRLYDEFTFVYPFSVLILVYYLTRFQLRLVWHGIPPYMDFSFRFMTFFFWRMPTPRERRFIPFYPFSRKYQSAGDISQF